MRSWYGYALNRAHSCVWMPVGTLEGLDRQLAQRLAKVQLQLNVPSLISTKLIPASLRSRIPKYGTHHWIRAASWNSLSVADRVKVLHAWADQNEIFDHEGPTLEELPVASRHLLRFSGFHRLLNRYSSASGPNCFAAAAAFASASLCGIELAKQWMHGPPFLSHLRTIGYERVPGRNPRTGDVLVFFKGRQAVHAGFYLGDGFYFEKPGQDFYEPYRVERFDAWTENWSHTSLALWRLKAPKRQSRSP